MINVVDLTQHYGVRPVLRNVNLTVNRGELVVLLGPNGMGKTTLLAAMAGVLSPQKGYVEIDGLKRKSSVENELAIRKRVVYLPDHPWLPVLRTGREFLLSLGKLYGIDADRLMEHVDRLLDLFELVQLGDSPIRSYSNGQQKKIAICAALVTEAPVMLLDEPFSGGLDPAGLLALKRVLQRLLGLMLRLAQQPWAAAAIAAVTYLVSLWGLRGCLARFPWADRPKGEDAFDQSKQQDRDVGWPLKQLCPTSSAIPVPAVNGFLISVLVGWWLYAGASLNSDPRDRSEFLGLVYATSGSAAIIGRCAIYMWGYLPPISLWGRVRTSRWIIPGYDQIFVAPLCILAVWTAANPVWKLTDPLFVVPIAVSLFLVIAFNMGPTLKRWYTTGRHRMAPFLIKGQYQKI